MRLGQSGASDAAGDDEDPGHDAQGGRMGAP